MSPGKNYNSCAGSKKSCRVKLSWHPPRWPIMPVTNVRLASTGRRRPAPLHPIRLGDSALCESAWHTRHRAWRWSRLRRRLRACARGIVLSLERMNRIREINAGDFVAVVQPASTRRNCRRPSRNVGFFIRLTQPAARTISLAATSPPMPAARAASNTASPAIMFSASKSSLLTARWSGSGAERTKTRPALTSTAFCRLRGPARRGHRSHAEIDSAAAVPANLAVGFGSMKNAVSAMKAILTAGFLPCALELADEFTLAALTNAPGANAFGIAAPISSSNWMARKNPSGPRFRTWKKSSAAETVVR